MAVSFLYSKILFSVAKRAYMKAVRETVREYHNLKEADKERLKAEKKRLLAENNGQLPLGWKDTLVAPMALDERSQEVIDIHEVKIHTVCS